MLTPPNIQSELNSSPEEDPQVENSSRQAWLGWKRSPSPNTMAEAVNSVKPVITKAVARYPGVNPGVLGGEAKRLAIAAIKSYDPSQGTSLQTHVFAHLRPLVSAASGMTKAIDRTRTDRQLTSQFLGAQTELRELLNREPTDDELVDHMKVPHKHLEKMRRVAVGELPEDDYFDKTPDHEEDPNLSLWGDYVYSKLSPQDKLIFEHKTGRNGRPTLSSAETGAKLDLSEVYVNRRAADIANRILEGAQATERARN